MLCGVVVIVVVGSVRSIGLFARIATFAENLWTNLTDWLSAPFSMDHVLAGAGVLLVPILILIVIFAIADN